MGKSNGESVGIFRGIIVKCVKFSQNKCNQYSDLESSLVEVAARIVFEFVWIPLIIKV